MSMLNTPFGSFEVQRYPASPDPSLRAWDAADEYALAHLNDISLDSNSDVWLLNDQFGALATALHSFNLISFSDSWLAHQATRKNLAKNALSSTSVMLHSTLELTDTNPTVKTSTPQLVIVKIPKSLAMLEDQLARLHQLLSPEVPVVFAGMVKHMSNNIWPTIEKNFGDTQTSLAKKKAKLIFAQKQRTQCPANEKYPSEYQVPELSLNLQNHAGVFSRDSLDIGTRFLLGNLEQLSTKPNANIVDLACGNGVIGIQLAKAYPAAQITFTDESFMAVASAKLNAAAHLDSIAQHRFDVQNSLKGIDAFSQDVIVVNPPFHQQNTVSDQVAKEMFKQSFRCLHPKGQLWVVANRHLAYHTVIKRIFGHCDLVSSNKKFVVLRAQKSQ